MLVLTRYINERIIINDHIVMQLLGIKGHQVRFGFEAPFEISIHRQEIFDRIHSREPESTTRQGRTPSVIYKRPRIKPEWQGALL